jgi:hypothetical protein
MSVRDIAASYRPSSLRAGSGVGWSLFLFLGLSFAAAVELFVSDLKAVLFSDCPNARSANAKTAIIMNTYPI